MGLFGKIAYNTIFSAVARIIAVGISVVSLAFLARYLGKDGFGDYSLILSFLYIFNILADFGLYSLMTREISHPQVDEKKIASNIFTLRIVALLFFLGIAVVLVWLFPYSEKVKIGTAIASLSYLFLSAAQVLMGIFQKNLRIDKAGIADILGRAIQLLLIILFVRLRFHLFWFLVALNLGCFLNFILNWFFARKYLSFGFAFDFSYWKKIIKEAIPIAASIVLTLIYFKFDTIFLSLKIINRSSLSPISDVGIYNVAYKVLEGLIFFPAMFVGLIMPLLSRFAVSDRVKFKIILQKALDFLIIFMVPTAIGLVVLASPIVLLIGGKEFLASGPVLKILSIAIALIFLGNLFGSSVIALKKQKTGAYIYLGSMLFNVFANLIFIPKYSYFGASWTTVLTEILVTIFLAALVFREVNYLPRLSVAIKSILAGVFLFIFLKIFPVQNLFLLMGLGAIVYFAALYLIGGIKKQDLKLLIEE